MLTPKISVIVPIYKIHIKYLHQCVDSICCQSLSAIEIILVDDGSPDHCGAVCDDYAQRDNRVKVIHQSNQGVSVARNNGIKAATAEWIICVDSDDWVEPTLCEEITAAVENNTGIDFVLFSLAREFGKKTQPIFSMYENGRKFNGEHDMAILQRDVLEHPLQNNILVFPYCKAVKKEVLMKAQPVFPEGVAMCEDVLSAFKLFGFVTQGIYYDQPLYHYRQQSSSAVYKYRENADKEQMQLLQMLTDMIKKSPNREFYTKGYNREVFYAAQRAFSQKLYHRDSKMSWHQRRKACAMLFNKEPFYSGLRDVDVHGLSKNHKLKCFLLKNGMYELCACMYRLYYMMLGKNIE